MFPLDYSFAQNHLMYKHTVTEKPPCNSYFTHSHNLFELLYFISGDATCIIEDRKYTLKKGDLVFIRPSKYHFIQINSSTRYERYDVLFSIDKLKVKESFLPKDVEVINLQPYPIADGVFKRIDFYYENIKGEQFATVLKSLLTELLICINVISKKIEKAELPIVNPLLSLALKYINANLFTIKNVSEVSDSVFVTESYLFRLFKKELKQSPKKYILSKRLLTAQNLILTGEQPTKVYLKCGFNDYTTFYKSYKNMFKQAPSKENKSAVDIQSTHEQN